MQTAALNRSNQFLSTPDYPDMDPYNTPKALEAFLYGNIHYEMKIYLGLKPYIAIKTLINEELGEMYAKCKTNEALEKYTLAEKTYAEIKAKLEINPEKINETSTLLIFLKTMLPVLDSLESGSSKTIRSFARRIGIFERDIKGFELSKTEEPVKRDSLFYLVAKK